MKNPLNNDDFEFYLEQEVNQHRMYPSDKIWRNIQQDIHGYKKWPALTVITLFVISALVVGTVLIKPQKQTLTTAAANAAAQKADDSAARLLPPPENAQEHFSADHITQQTIARVQQETDIDITGNIGTALSAYNNGISTMLPAESMAAISDNAPAAAIITDASTAQATVNISATTGAGLKAIAKKEVQLPAKAMPPAFNWFAMAPNDNIKLNGQALIMPNSGKVAVKKSSGFTFSLFGKRENVTYAGLSLDNNFTQPVRKPFTFKPRSHKFDFTFYATPSVSYRSLKYSKQASPNHTYISGLPYNANYTVDLGRATHNKPAMGYEVGAGIGYKLNDILTMRGGFQFNMREYDIEAYKNPGSYSDVAASSNTSLGGGVDVSNQSTVSLKGNDKTVLPNRYYQLSMPVGLDATVWNGGRFSIGVAGTVQPTYIFDKDPFIITSDYKNYIDGSKLVRNWNLNTSVESYLSYTTGQFKWRLGPQFRYQVLSTLSGNYPIKEHLLDYGVKLGFIKTF